MTKNLDHQSYNPIESFCSAIVNMVKWANNNGPLLFWERLNLEEFRSCFPATKSAQFLSERSLDKILQFIQNKPGDIRENIPKGLQITAVAIPCNANGLQLHPSSFDDSRNENQPYVRLLYSLPGNQHGLATGLGNSRPAPLLQLFPEEIIQQCSFIVDYDQSPALNRLSINPDEEANVNDYLYLVENIKAIYAELQQLLKK